MSNVTDFNEHKLKGKPHLSGNVRCNSCKHEWVAVSEIGNMDGLECPQCGLYRGSFIANIASDTGELVFTCDCGCQSYYLRLCSPEGKAPRTRIYCHGCGAAKGVADLDTV